MLSPRSHHPRGVAPRPALDAADLQAQLITATRDLDRLQTLLAHACEQLMQGFQGANRRILEFTEGAGRDAGAPEMLDGVMQQLGGAITALQFHDMAAQLIAHTHKRLRNCADRIGPNGGDDEGATAIEAMALHATPVAQDAMQAGSIELF